MTTYQQIHETIKHIHELGATSSHDFALKDLNAFKAAYCDYTLIPALKVCDFIANDIAITVRTSVFKLWSCDEIIEFAATHFDSITDIYKNFNRFWAYLYRNELVACVRENAFKKRNIYGFENVPIQERTVELFVTLIKARDISTVSDLGKIKPIDKAISNQNRIDPAFRKKLYTALGFKGVIQKKHIFKVKSYQKPIQTRAMILDKFNKTCQQLASTNPSVREGADLTFQCECLFKAMMPPTLIDRNVVVCALRIKIEGENDAFDIRRHRQAQNFKLKDFIDLLFLLNIQELQTLRTHYPDVLTLICDRSFAAPIFPEQNPSVTPAIEGFHNVN